MTEKKYRIIVKKLGGVVDTACVVDFPKTLHITTKKDAIGLLRVLLPDSEQIEHFTVNQDVPLKALRKAIKRGLL